VLRVQRVDIAQGQGDQEPADPAVAIEKRVDGLELDVDQGGLQEHRSPRRDVVEEPLEVSYQMRNALGRRRNERSGPGVRSTEPVLGLAEVSRSLVTPPPAQEGAVSC